MERKQVLGQDLVENYLAELVNVRAQLGWATHGHSAVDVNLYGYGKQSHKLAGSRENTEIGDFIVDHLGLDLKIVTELLSGDDHSGTLLRDEVNFKPKHYHAGQRNNN